MKRFISFFAVAFCLFGTVYAYPVNAEVLPGEGDNQWQLETETKSIELSSERYIINITYPEYSLNGQTLDAFNGVIFELIEQGKNEFVDMAGVWVIPGGIKSELNGNYTTHTGVSRYITARIDLYPYLGGIHPAHTIDTITFDYELDRVISLSDFFKKDSGYLEMLSELSEKALFEKYPELEFAFNTPSFRKGFEPVEENFSSWALTDSGLVIFFPEYQVAPFAAGTLDIEIPYEDMEGHMA